jgi:hypothetical protein
VLFTGGAFCASCVAPTGETPDVFSAASTAPAHSSNAQASATSLHQVASEPDGSSMFGKEPLAGERFMHE